MTQPRLKPERDAVTEHQKPAPGEIVEVYNRTLKEALAIVRTLISGSRIDAPPNPESK
jgi:hypothetical protein